MDLGDGLKAVAVALDGLKLALAAAKEKGSTSLVKMDVMCRDMNAELEKFHSKEDSSASTTLDDDEKCLDGVTEMVGSLSHLLDRLKDAERTESINKFQKMCYNINVKLWKFQAPGKKREADAAQPQGAEPSEPPEKKQKKEVKATKTGGKFGWASFRKNHKVECDAITKSAPAFDAGLRHLLKDSGLVDETPTETFVEKCMELSLVMGKVQAAAGKRGEASDVFDMAYKAIPALEISEAPIFQRVSSFCSELQCILESASKVPKRELFDF